MLQLASYLIFLTVDRCAARMFCERTKAPLEVGTWGRDLKHLDSAVVENGAVSVREGQVYVYENYFPGHVIKYIHVDNVAIRSCGASAVVKKGGIDSPSILIVLHAESNEEIRSVVDIWGKKIRDKVTTPPESYNEKKTSHLFRDFRTVNHNGFKRYAFDKSLS